MILEIADFLKSIKDSTPIITFFLGALLAPLVESNKQKLLTNRILKSFKLELEDEIFQLDNHIKNVSIATLNLEAMNGEIINAKKGIVKYAPRPIKLHLMKQVQENAFISITRNQRTSLKAIAIQLNYIEEIREKLIKLETNQGNLGEILKLNKKWLYTSTCMYYTMKYFLNSKDIKSITEIGDEEAINTTMNLLKINLKYNDLIVRNSQKITESPQL